METRQSSLCKQVPRKVGDGRAGHLPEGLYRRLSAPLDGRGGDLRPSLHPPDERRHAAGGHLEGLLQHPDGSWVTGPLGFNKGRWYQSTFVCWGALAFITHNCALLRKDDSAHARPITAWYHKMSRLQTRQEKSENYLEGVSNHEADVGPSPKEYPTARLCSLVFRETRLTSEHIWRHANSLCPDC